MLRFHKIAVFLVSLLLLCSVHAQNKGDYKYIDSLTYHLYLNENWKDLNRLARNAFKNELDYYYLRMRAGIASFKQNKYSQATKHFKKALLFNHLDPYPMEYLSYSYLYSGKKDDAKYFYNNSKTKYTLPEIPELELKPVSEVIVNTAFFHNMENSPENKIDIINIYGIDGYQIISKQFSSNSLFLKHDISPSFYLSQAATVIFKTQYYLSSYNGGLYENNNNRALQYQYYLSAKVIPFQNFSILGSFHYINYRIPSFYIYDTFNSTRYFMNGIYKNYIAGDISIFKTFNYFKTGLGLSLANLNEAGQLQKNFTLVFFPLGNLNLYLTSVLNHVKETKTGIVDEINILFRQTLGTRIFNRLWIETTAYTGSLKNGVLNEGYLIYNTNEPVRKRYDVTFIFPFDRLTCNIFFSYYTFSSEFMLLNGINSDSNNMNFSSFLSSISLKWNL